MKTLLSLVTLSSLMLLMGAQRIPGPGGTAPSGGGYTDNFPGSSLSGNWTACTLSGFGAPSVGTAGAASPYFTQSVYNAQFSPGNAFLIGYTAGTFGTNQQSQASKGGAYSNNGSPLIHFDPSTCNGYGWSGDGQSITKITGGVITNLTTSNPCSSTGLFVTNGDVLKLSNIGPTITILDVTTGLSCTAVDGTYTAGYAGLSGFSGNMFAVTTSWGIWSGQ